MASDDTIAEKKPSPPRDPVGRWLWLRAGLIAFAIASFTLGALTGAEIIWGEPDEDDLVYGLTGLAAFVIVVAAQIWCVIFTSLLVYRLTANTHKLEPPVYMTTGPFWAVAWFFIPIANVWIAVTTIGRIWEATASLDDNFKPANGQIGAWWAAYLGGNFAINWSLRLAERDHYQLSLYFSLAGFLALALACWLMARVFGPLARAQRELIAQRAQAQVSPA